MAKLSKLRLKLLVRERAKGCCEYCLSQENYSPDVFSVEHILPICLGGKTILINLAFSCQFCNNKKYIFIEWTDPLTGELVALFNPRQNEWTSHFQWNEEFSQIIGLTPTGRATIEKLQLNRTGVVNLRMLLRKSGEHPPV